MKQYSRFQLRSNIASQKVVRRCYSLTEIVHARKFTFRGTSGVFTFCGSVLQYNGFHLRSKIPFRTDSYGIPYHKRFIDQCARMVYCTPCREIYVESCTQRNFRTQVKSIVHVIPYSFPQSPQNTQRSNINCTVDFIPLGTP